MDIETTIAVVGSAITSKDLLIKVFGPTADYIGGEFQNLVERCNINLSDVLRSSIRKGSASAPGSVDARTAKAILDDAAYCDDGLVKDYYGGFLRAAKTDNQDDTSLSYVRLLQGLSRAQVHTHFLIYASFHRQLNGKLPSITLEEHRNSVYIILELDDFLSFIGRQRSQWEATVNHIINGLCRNELIGPFFQYGPKEYFHERFPDIGVERPSLVVCPTTLGAELFLWAAGFSDPNPNLILDPDTNILAHFPDEFVKALAACHDRSPKEPPRDH